MKKVKYVAIAVVSVLFFFLIVYVLSTNAVNESKRKEFEEDVQRLSEAYDALAWEKQKEEQDKTTIAIKTESIRVCIRAISDYYVEAENKDYVEDYLETHTEREELLFAIELRQQSDFSIHGDFIEFVEQRMNKD